MESSSNFGIPDSSLGLHHPPPPPPPPAAAEMSEGWSVYIDDLVAAQDMLLAADANSSSFGPHPAAAAAESSSTVSDAASCVPAWSRAAATNAHVESAAARREHKRATARGSRSLLVDDALEDTASSPLSSPKLLSETDHMGILSSEVTRKHATATGNDMYEEINGAAGSFFASLGELKETRETVGRGSYECSELRRRGLCLVPVSMLIDYLK